MENNTLVINEQAYGTEQLLKLTTLVYLKEALAAQQYETCKELVETAKKAGVQATDISAAIADYLKGVTPGATRQNRLR